MKRIAILIPCFNEEKTIGKLIQDFKKELPDSDIYVYDNNSTDHTVAEAKKAGATVCFERRQGKGNVIRSMFRQIEADIYVMIDGDGTYPPEKVHDLIEPIIDNNFDVVLGSRLHPESKSEFKSRNRFGNKLFLFFLKLIFKVEISDLLTGYRAFSREVVKSLPIISTGFEIETEMTVRCLERKYRILEVPINLISRPEGSESKIRIISDGLMILKTMFVLFRDYKPLSAFGKLGLFIILCGFIPGIIVIREFILTGLILRIPSTILAVGLVLSGLITVLVGILLHTISRRFQEIDYLLQEIISKQSKEI